MKAVVTVFALLLFVRPVLADDHLEPEQSLYADNLDHTSYDRAVVTVLSYAFGYDVRARLVGLPSFQPEFAVGVIGDPGAYRIFSVTSKVALWSYIHDHAASQADLEKVAVERCEAPVGGALAARILASWRGELAQVHFGDLPSFGADGIVYHFAMFDRIRIRFLAGQVWSPPVHSAPGLLVGLGDAMADYCGSKDAAALERAEKNLETYRASQH